MGVLKNALPDNDITYRQFKNFNGRGNSQRKKAKPGEHKGLKNGTSFLEIGYPTAIDIQVEILRNVIIRSVSSEVEVDREYDYLIFELNIADFDNSEVDTKEQEALLSEHDIEIKTPPIG